jgi:EGF-like domain
LNYCGTREPCHNGGTCENTKPDEYLCKCPEGFSGTNCEVVDNVCATAPCLHGGTCTVTTTVVTNGISGSTGGGSFNCTCPPGWTGDTCQISKTFLNAFQLISVIPPGSFSFVVCCVMSCCLTLFGGDSGGRREQVNSRDRKEGKKRSNLVGTCCWPETVMELIKALEHHHQ